MIYKGLMHDSLRSAVDLKADLLKVSRDSFESFLDDRQPERRRATTKAK